MRLNVRLMRSRNNKGRTHEPNRVRRADWFRLRYCRWRGCLLFSFNIFMGVLMDLGNWEDKIIFVVSTILVLTWIVAVSKGLI